MKKIFITRKLTPLLSELLTADFEVVSHSENAVLPREKLLEVVRTYDGILSTMPDKIDREVLSEAGSQLKVICNYASGLDNIDVAAARERGISVFNASNAVTHSTADFTFAAFLSFLRKISKGQAFVREGKWISWDPWLFLGEDLPGKTFGILGYGRIGKAVARRARGFDLNVIFSHYREVDPEVPGVKQVPWEEMLEQVDYLSLHVPATAETIGMIDYPTIQKMSKRPIIINMARGPVVKTDDLVRALEQNLLRGAVLDVTDPEPLPANHPLCHMENCLVVPHLGSSTIDCREITARETAANFKKGFNI
ncbi:2-hydroxyacid dehydrogenase [Simkania negevensis]|uniref:Glyoxylate reductase n=1 Tax=Simkania negevensis (strain ATCC VR-1471 / DSM 27360 / Z) TaxID=331113 RepID=F8L8Q3_SIMNZ|nr:D-glycerate dehydrogenase [Simkania negevensis]CCB89196.1 glyoxylate reductase [Simkania negevensis Z]